MYELICQYDTRKSFYGKAIVKEETNERGFVETLFSYNTEVAEIVTDFRKKKKIYNYFGNYSQTTTRHQKEFFRQNGLSEKELKELWKNGTLEKEL